MMMAGVSCGSSSHAITLASSSAVLLVEVFVPYAVGRGWTRESSGIVGRSIHIFVGCELLIAVMVTLAAARAVAGVCGCRGG